jgi:hypothetical protein
MAKYEYKHIKISGAKVNRSGGFMGAGKRTEKSAYPLGSITAELNRHGSDGWEIVDMEAIWYWERESISAAVAITHPFEVTGWYCTFKREQ